MRAFYMWCRKCMGATEHSKGKGKVTCMKCRTVRREKADKKVPNIFPGGRGF